jgi:hypothetical protein
MLVNVLKSHQMDKTIPVMVVAAPIMGTTDKLPRPRTGKKRSKYSPLCEKVMALEDGKWL